MGSLRPPTPTSPPPLPPTSPLPSSRPTMLLSPSSRMSPPMEPRPSLDPSVPTRPSTSQLSTKPVPTPSRLFPRLLLLQSMLSLRFQLPLPTLPQLLLPTLPQLLLPMVLTLLLLPLLWLPKQRPKSSSVPKSERERELYVPCAVSDFLRHTRLYNRKVGVSWWLFLVSLRTASNVSNALQYDVTTSITSGLFLLLNVLYVRYRRELFINKSVLF